MDKINKFLDWFAGVSYPAQQEDDRFTKLDQSVARMKAAHDEFAVIVGHVVRDLDSERRHRRAHAKNTTRPHKT
jgi:hypothetical protein